MFNLERTTEKGKGHRGGRDVVESFLLCVLVRT